MTILGVCPSTIPAWQTAVVALARRLGVIMHRMWCDGTEFRWTKKNALAAGHELKVLRLCLRRDGTPRRSQVACRQHQFYEREGLAPDV
jgi:hypothetical protein